jgi:hypothetical protein
MLTTACAFYGLTSVILPFTATSHNPVGMDSDTLELLKVAEPQVLILPAGLAIEDLKGLKSLKAIIVVDISTGPHMDWSTEQENTVVRTWDQLLESEAQHEPSDPPQVAIQGFVKFGSEYKTVNFSQEVDSSH